MLRIVLFLSFLAGSVSAGESTMSPIMIMHPQAAASIGNAKTAAGYLVVENHGEAADRLLGVEGDFPRVELHTMVEEDGVMKMTHLAEGVEVPAGGMIMLAPGGMHVMFMGLTEPFVVGETVHVTLIFEHAGRVEVDLEVVPRESLPKPGGMGMGNMDHG